VKWVTGHQDQGRVFPVKRDSVGSAVDDPVIADSIRTDVAVRRLQNESLTSLNMFQKREVGITMAGKDHRSFTSIGHGHHVRWSKRQGSAIGAFQDDLIDAQTGYNQSSDRPGISSGPRFHVLLSGQRAGPSPL